MKIYVFIINNLVIPSVTESVPFDSLGTRTKNHKSYLFLEEIGFENYNKSRSDVELFPNSLYLMWLRGNGNFRNKFMNM
jgi:hypothetical protein